MFRIMLGVVYFVADILISYLLARTNMGNDVMYKDIILVGTNVVYLGLVIVLCLGV